MRNKKAYRKHRIEPLEDRRLLTTLSHTYFPDPVGPQEDAKFGVSIAVSENYRVVGAADSVATNSQLRLGNVYLYDADNQLIAELDDPTPTNFDDFGAAVATGGPHVAIGSPGDDSVPFNSNTGEAHVFDAATGELRFTIDHPEPGTNPGSDRFGGKLDISGDRVLIGHSGLGTRAYLFDLSTGNLLRSFDGDGSNEQFSRSVAIQNDIVLVGAPGNDEDDLNSGVVYVFDANTGERLRVLRNPTPDFDDQFGDAIAIDDGIVAVASPNDDELATNAGKVYLFDLSSGALLRTLQDPEPIAGDRFGTSVAIENGTVLVGAYGDSSGPEETGRAFAFDVASGNLIQTFQNPTKGRSFGSLFGNGVALLGDDVFVAAFESNVAEDAAGEVHAFSLATGELTGGLENVTTATNDAFGSGVAITDKFAIVGAIEDDASISDTGSISVFERGTGELVAKLLPPVLESEIRFGQTMDAYENVLAVSASRGATRDGVAYLYDLDTVSFSRALTNPGSSNEFGESVAIHGNRVAVGAPGDDQLAPNSGAVYIFDSATGEVQFTIPHPFPIQSDAFGDHVSLNDQWIIVGTPGDDDGANESGKIYVFDHTGEYVRSIENPSPARLDRFGSVFDLSGSTLIVGVENQGDNGAAYVFDVATGGLVDTVFGVGNDRDLGTSVAIDGSLAIIGSNWRIPGDDNIGRAYLYSVSAGELIGAMDNPTPDRFDYFSSSVAIDGVHGIVGAPFDDTTQREQGAGYQYRLNEVPTGVNWNIGFIPEDTASGSTLGSFTTLDPDILDTHNYKLVPGNGGADNALFSIVDGSLIANTDFDFETRSSYSLRVRTTDPFGQFFERLFSLPISNVNESPTGVAVDSNRFDENPGIGAGVFQLSSCDIDFGGFFGQPSCDYDSDQTGFTYEFVNGEGDDDNDRFSLSGGIGAARSGFDFETDNAFSIRVRTTDEGGLSFTQVIQLTLNDVNEPPTDISVETAIIDENLAPGFSLGQLSGIDPDANDELRFSLVAGDGDDGNDHFELVGKELVTKTSFDFEAQREFSIRLRATDLGGEFYEEAIRIRIRNLPETPTDLQLSPTVILENRPIDSVVGNLIGVDPDRNERFTFTLVQGDGDRDNGRFEILGDELRARESFDFETRSAYQIRLRVTDRTGLSFEKAFEIVVENVNEPPTGPDIETSSIAESLPAGSLVSQLFASDPDIGDAITYELVSGDGDRDNTRFVIVNGELRSREIFDFETLSQLQVRVAAVDAGGLAAESSLVINVIDVNEPPTVVSLDRNSFVSSIGLDDTIAHLSAFDPDAGEQVSFRLVAGEGAEDNSLFRIEDTAIRLSPDFDRTQLRQRYTIRVSASDTAGLSRETQFDLTLIPDFTEASVVRLTFTDDLLVLDDTGQFRYTAGQSDIQILISPGVELRTFGVPLSFVQTRLIGGVVAQQYEAGNKIIAAMGGGWTLNALPVDVDASGDITAADALRTINELSRQQFTEDDGETLVNPNSLQVFPDVFLDPNADGRLTALDALIVINALARQAQAGEGEMVVSTRPGVNTISRSDATDEVFREWPGRFIGSREEQCLRPGDVFSSRSVRSVASRTLPHDSFEAVASDGGPLALDRSLITQCISPDGNDPLDR